MDRLTFTDEEMKKIGEDFTCPIKSNSDDENDIITRFCDRVCDEFQYDCPFEKVGKALKAYEDTGITPDQMRDISRLYQKKCEELIACQRNEHNNSWIPCSSGKMPEEHDSIFAKAKGTDKWNDAMFEKTSDAVNVTVSDEKGNTTTTHAHTIDGKWSCDLLKCNKSYQIIAWQPLPEPYTKGE